jgi:hypothetical protein
MLKYTVLTVALLFMSSIGFAQPADNAGDPEARESENVVSIYGDFYTTIDGVNYNPNWGQSGVDGVDPEYDPGTGNTVLAYPNFNYQGTEFTAQDLSAMEYLHVDIWVAEGTSRIVKLTPIDNSGNGPGEVLVEVPLTPGSWNSVSLPKSAFTGMTWQSIFQLKFDGQFNADGSANTEPFDVYVDNIFFWKNASTPQNDATLSDLQVDNETVEGFSSTLLNYEVNLVTGTTEVPQITEATATNSNASVTITQATGVPGTASVEVVSESGNVTNTYSVNFLSTIPATAAPTPPQISAEGVISLFSDTFTDIDLDTLSVEFDDSDYEIVMVEDNPTLLIKFANFIGVDFQNNRQDMSDMTHFHIDFWTGKEDLDGTVFNVKLSEWGGTAGEVAGYEFNINEGTSPAIVNDTWVSVDVPLSSFGGTASPRGDIAQFLITSNLGDVYVDNIYFYDEGAPLGVGDDITPESFKLRQNYPNPFNPSTNISYTLPANGKVTLEVFTIQGQKVATVVDEVKGAGSHTATFNATNLASGVYTYILTSEAGRIVNKMTLIK